MNSAFASIAVALFLTAQYSSSAEPVQKQPVFVFFPSSSEYSAWSLYLIVDEKDRSKILSLGLENLKYQNPKNSTYSNVLSAQNNPDVARELVAELGVACFDSGQLNVKKMDVLHITLSRQPDGSLTLMISMRVSVSGRFVIGGTEQAKRNIALKYDPVRRVWQAQIKVLSDYNGTKVPEATGKTITGIAFPLTSTGVYRVLGVLENGDAITLMDRSELE